MRLHVNINLELDIKTTMMKLIYNWLSSKQDKKFYQNRKTYSGALTVEAALVTPIFLYFMIAFLYFIQIFTIQEQLQASATKMGLDLSKAAYFYQDFPDLSEVMSFDKSLLPEGLNSMITDESDKFISESSLFLYARRYMDKDCFNRSCIKGGFNGINFSYSSILNDENIVDIILRYKVNLPIKIIHIGDMNMLQRVRLRAWTGFSVAPLYGTNQPGDEEMVYITETGTVYHKTSECSHIKLSIREVTGVPSDLRNVNGAKYYPCETCCKSGGVDGGIFYITSDGTRYHTSRGCSGLKRTIKKVPISQVGTRSPCTRCGK